MVYEQIVFAPLQVQVRRESFLAEEHLFAIGEVAADTHVRTAGEGEAQIAQRAEQIVECRPFVKPSLRAGISAVTQYDFRLRREIPRQHLQPLVACRSEERRVGKECRS